MSTSRKWDRSSALRLCTGRVLKSRSASRIALVALRSPSAASSDPPCSPANPGRCASSRVPRTSCSAACRATTAVGADCNPPANPEPPSNVAKPVCNRVNPDSKARTPGNARKTDFAPELTAWAESSGLPYRSVKAACCQTSAMARAITASAQL
eukprot:6193897-Pleurochrysis_carterae.AAC.1